MAEIDIFPEQTVEGFAANDDFAGLHTAFQATDVNLVLGETYWVVWDGTEWEVVAQDASVVGDGAVLLGNGVLLGLSSNDEPFVIGTVSGTIFFASMAETTESHVIRIYQKTESVEEETPEGIVLRNYDGIDETYSSVEKIIVRASTGDKQMYSKGIAVEGVEIELDFSEGDQTVNAADGYLVKSAVIKKPETLAPENIRIGVEIGGVTGDYEIETEEKTVELDFSEGDMVLTPDDGKLWNQVNIPVPANLVPENIAKDVEIAGVVGALESSGGSATEPYIEYTLNGSGKVVAAKLYGFTTIPAGCFAYSTALTSVDLTESPSITAIGDYAFYNCSSLTSITIPDGVATIGQYAFFGCAALASITIPDGVATIGQHAFYGCAALASITIPGGVTSISNNTFTGCSALTSITIPDGVTTIGNYAFYNCSALTSVTIGSGATRIGLHAFGSTALTYAKFKDTTTWYRTTSASATSGGTSMYPLSTSTAAEYLKTKYASYYWYKL